MPKTERDAIFGSISQALSYKVGTPERAAINDAYFHVQRLLNVTALGGLLPALLCGLMMKNVRLSRGEVSEGQVPLSEVLGE